MKTESFNLTTAEVLAAIDRSPWFDYVFKDPESYTDETPGPHIHDTLWTWDSSYRDLDPLVVLLGEDMWWTFQQVIGLAPDFKTFAGWNCRVAEGSPHDIIVIGPAQGIVEQSVFREYTQPYTWKGLSRPLEGRASMLIPILRERELVETSSLTVKDLALPGNRSPYGLW